MISREFVGIRINRVPANTRVMTSKRVYAGIDIGGTSIKYGLFDKGGKVLFREQRPTLVDKGASPLMHLITNISESLLYHAAEEEYEVPWLGVGTPGAVDYRTGTVVGQSPNIKGWQGTKIGQQLKDRLNMPVIVDNDVNAMALAELKFGAAMGFSNVVCVTVGTGVGGGLILDGKLWRGTDNLAGELGHLSIDPAGPECRCGSRGCIEAFCSSSAIMERAQRKLSDGLSSIFEDVLGGSIDNLSIRKLFAAARKGDETASEVIAETAEFLGAGLASVVNLLNPEIVIIGGGVADGGAGFIEKVGATVRDRAFTAATENLKITRASLGNDAGFIGAGMLGEVDFAND